MEFEVLNTKEIHTVGRVEWNYKELKENIIEAMQNYDGIVVTLENVKDCKAKRATLNKFRTALENARKSIKKEINAPYEQFATELADALAPVNEQIANLDTQIKAIEDSLKNVPNRTTCKYEVVVTPDKADLFEKYLKRNEYEYKILG